MKFISRATVAINRDQELFGNYCELYGSLNQAKIFVLHCMCKDFDQGAFDEDILEEENTFELHGYILEALDEFTEDPVRCLNEAHLNLDGKVPMLMQAHGIVSWCKNFSKGIVSATAQAAVEGIGMTAFLETMKGKFDELMGDMKEVVYTTFGWLKTVWQRFKTWAEHIVSKLTGWAYHVLDGIVVAVAILGSSIFLHAIEKFLLGAKILSCSYGFAKIFLLSIGALLSTRFVVGAFSDNTAADMDKLVNKLCFEVVAMFPKHQWQTFFPGEVGPFNEPNNGLRTKQAHFNPMELLQVISKTMSGFSTSAIVETGKFFNAVEQIKRGFGTVKEVGQAIFAFFAELFGSILGKRSQFLSDASALVGHDVGFWINRCEAQLRDAITGRSPADAVERGYKLISQGRSILNKIEKCKIKLSNIYMQQIVKLKDKLELVVSSLDRAGDGGQRKTPFCVAFVGPSRTGKSELRQRMEKWWLRKYGYGDGDVYARTSSDLRWTSYNHQAICSFDDLGAIKIDGNKTEETFFLPMISSAPYMLDIAAMEQKGTFFTSSLVTYSSNFEVCSAGSGVGTPSAFNNRRNLIVRVERNGQPYDPVEVWKCQKWTLLDCDGSEIFEIEDTQDESKMEVLQKLFAERYEAHSEKEGRVLEANATFKPKLADELSTIAKLVSWANQLLSPVTAEIMAGSPRHTLLGYYKKSFWALDSEELLPDGSHNVEKVNHLFITEAQKQAAKLDCQTMSITFGLAVSGMRMVSDTSKVYFQELVNSDVVTANLGINEKAVIDPTLIEVLREEPKWFRLVIGTVREATEAESKGMFQEGLDFCYEKMKNVYSVEMKSWSFQMKLLVGFVTVCLFGGTIHCVFKKLCGFLGTSDVLESNKLLHSDPFGKKGFGSDEGPRYRFRDHGLKARFKYAHGKEDCVYSEEQKEELIALMDKHMVEIKIQGQRFMCCQLPGQRLLACVHYFELAMFKEGKGKKYLAHVTYGDGTEKDITLDLGKIVHLPNTELCVIENNQLAMGRKSLYENFLFDPKQEFGGTFPAIQLSYNVLLEKDDPMKCAYEETVVSVSEEVSVLESGAYKNSYTNALLYRAVTLNGDCGALLVTFDKKKKPVIVGLHVAGDKLDAEACKIPYFPKPTGEELNFVTYFPTSLKVGRQLHCIGKLDGKYVKVSEKTSYEKTPEKWHLGKPVEKEPAILSKHDVRLKGTSFEGEFCPYESGIKKYAESAARFDPEILDKCAKEMFSRQKDLAGTLKPSVTIDEAINGFSDLDFCESLVMSTSEGVPHIFDRKPGETGKHRYFGGEPGARYLLEGTTVDKAYKQLKEDLKKGVPDLVCVENAKDEKVALRKIYSKPKTRLFSVLPVEFNLQAREMFLPYMSFLMSNRDQLPCQVGINPYSREWDGVAKRLKKVGSSVLCCDYSLFDGLMTAQLMKTLADGINDVAGGSDELKIMRENMLMAVVNRKSIVKANVYKIECGIPSGFAMTVIINSLLNELIVRYAFHHLMERYSALNKFDQLVNLVVYGDDNLIAVAGNIVNVFNGKLLKDFLATLNIQINDGTDKTLPTLEFHTLEEVDFLQRKFVLQYDGVYAGPLNHASLWSQLQYVKTKEMSITEAYLDAAENVLRELYLHSTSEFYQARNAMLQIGFIKSTDLRTFDNYHEFFQAQQGHRAMECATLESLLSPELVAAFAEETPKVPRQQMVPKVSVATFSGYVKQPGDFCVYFGCGVSGPDSVRVTWPAACGVGMLPAHTWMLANFVGAPRNHPELRKKVITEYNAGKHIVFISPARIVVAHVFCVMFLRMTNLISSIDANSALAEAVANVDALKYCMPAVTPFI